MIGRSRRNRDEQQSDVQTVDTEVVDVNENDNVGTDCSHRPSGSIRATTPSRSDVVVATVVTEDVFGERFLSAVREYRASHNKERLQKLTRKWQNIQTSAADMEAQLKANQAELYPLYRSYLRTRGITTGVVNQTCVIELLNARVQTD